jgi:NifB/MoaA-like Fe-S oxidoreductase
VLPGSPAYKAGIARGDHIIKLNGKEPVSRAAAYYMAQKAGNPELEVYRNGRTEKLTIAKPAASASGMVFNYDIHPDTILDIEKSILRNRGKRCLLLTSELAYEIIKLCVEQKYGVETEAVKNACFGGNIMCAGLLTIGDIEAHMAARQRSVEVILLPEIMFDTSGRDLLGRHFKELEASLGIKVEVV